MSEALEKLENTFTEETFTRKPLLNYTIKYFTDLSGIINDINDKNEINSAIDTAKTQLEKNPSFFRDHHVVSRTGICAEPQYHR